MPQSRVNSTLPEPPPDGRFPAAHQSDHNERSRPERRAQAREGFRLADLLVLAAKTETNHAKISVVGNVSAASRGLLPFEPLVVYVSKLLFNALEKLVLSVRVPGRTPELPPPAIMASICPER